MYCFTDFKAHWGKFVVCNFGLYKYKLIWLDWRSECLTVAAEAFGLREGCCQYCDTVQIFFLQSELMLVKLLQLLPCDLVSTKMFLELYCLTWAKNLMIYINCEIAFSSTLNFVQLYLKIRLVDREQWPEASGTGCYYEEAAVEMCQAAFHSKHRTPTLQKQTQQWLLGAEKYLNPVFTQMQKERKLPS